VPRPVAIRALMYKHHTKCAPHSNRSFAKNEQIRCQCTGGNLFK
jgi:hypothetical protein